MENGAKIQLLLYSCCFSFFFFLNPKVVSYLFNLFNLSHSLSLSFSLYILTEGDVGEQGDGPHREQLGGQLLVADARRHRCLGLQVVEE